MYRDRSHNASEICAVSSETCGPWTTSASFITAIRVPGAPVTASMSVLLNPTGVLAHSLTRSLLAFIA